MKAVKITIITDSPVIISENSTGKYIVKSRDYIPGSNILGAYAGKYIDSFVSKKHMAHCDENFHAFFLSGKIFFTNAYIMMENDNDKLVCFPTPISIQEPKKSKDKIACDKLFAETRENMQYKSIGGFGAMSPEGNYSRVSGASKSIYYHHQRTEGGVPQDEKLFSYEAIDSGQKFSGHIIAEENILKEFISKMGCITDIHIGLSKNAQYGKTKFIVDNEPFDFVSEIATSPIASINNENKTETHSMTFLSDAIIYNENGLSTGDVSDLLNVFDINGLTIQIKIIYCSTSRIEGYNSAWKLKRSSEVAFSAGTCIKFEAYKKENVSVEGDVCSILSKIQTAGIGERRGEGFGRIVFDYQKPVNHELSLNDLKNNNDELPEDKEPSDSIKKVFKNILEVKIKDVIESEALKTVNDIKREVKTQQISKSLISKLEALLRCSMFSKDDDQTENCLYKFSKDEFVKKIKGLNEKKVKNKLKKVYVGNRNNNLLDLLLSDSFCMNSAINFDEKQTIKKLIDNYSKYKIMVNAEKPDDEYYKIFYSRLFAALRKSISGIGGEI
jgi:CRISPR-associated protein Csx10